MSCSLSLSPSSRGTSAHESEIPPTAYPPRPVVLVIDDELGVRESLRFILKDDFEVLEAPDGAAGLEIVRSRRVDVALLDVRMPEYDGFDMLEMLGAEAPPAVIFVTAYDQYALRAFEVHAFDYLLKPFDRERFDKAWQRAKGCVAEGRVNRRDSRILALLEELKAGSQYIERLVIKEAGRVFFLGADDIALERELSRELHLR